jgi:hypothetical protein
MNEIIYAMINEMIAATIDTGRFGTSGGGTTVQPGGAVHGTNET